MTLVGSSSGKGCGGDGMKTATQAGRGYYVTANLSTIARQRRLARLTQKEAAVRCGVSLRTFQRAEAGDVVPHRVKRSIERALGLPW